MPPLSESMKLLNVLRCSAIAAALAGGGWTQTRIDLRTQAKSIDFSAASSTLPSQTGAVLPATCQVGATFILTTSLAGQNWYICTSANQWTLQSGSLPSLTGNSGSVLSNNGTALQWNALGGDISGAPGSVTVNKLLGRKLNTVAPTTGQFLGWDGSQWTAQTVTSSSSPVTSIFGRTGAVTAQTGDYSFAQISGSISSSQLPSSGGDLSGAITSATVTRIQSRAVSSSAPTTGQVLTWNGSQWIPQNANGGVPSVFGRTGAVVAQIGDYMAAQVTNAVDRTQPNSFSAGARQTFNANVNGAGIQLAPGPLPAAPLPGDLAVDSGDSNRMKVFSGSAWVSLNPALPPGNYTAFFTNSAVISIPGSTHNLGTANIIVQCYDNSSPSNLVEPSLITIDPASYTVTITFAAAESGRCVLNGYNGAGSGGASGGAGMASQLGDLAVLWTSPTTLSVGGNCSAATPCNVRFGSQVFPITTAASATLSSGTGVAYIYVDATGALNVGSSMTIACQGCIATPGITSFPVNTIPIATWMAVSGAWNSSGGADYRGWLSASPVLGGTGIAAVATAGQTTLSVDGAVVPTYLTASATLTFPAIPASTCSADATFPLPGANPGDVLAPGWPAALAAGLYGTMRVSATGIVSVRLCADASGAVTPAAATYAATVIRGF